MFFRQMAAEPTGCLLKKSKNPSSNQSLDSLLLWPRNWHFKNPNWGSIYWFSDKGKEKHQWEKLLSVATCTQLYWTSNPQPFWDMGHHSNQLSHPAELGICIGNCFTSGWLHAVQELTEELLIFLLFFLWSRM